MRRPKGIKTKKSVAKRFKITARGKVLRSERRQAPPGCRPRAPSAAAICAATSVVDPTDVYRIKQNLPFSH